MKTLTKATKCNQCGVLMEAGSEFAWDTVTVHHRWGGNGTVEKVTTHYKPRHEDTQACELARINPDLKVAAEILIADLEKELRSNEKSVGTWDFDPEMEVYIAEKIVSLKKHIEWRKKGLVKYLG